MNKYVIGKNRIVIMNSLAVFVALIIFLLLFASSAMSMGHDGVERLFGANRWATSANVALEAYPDGSASVIIARGDDAGGWADGLAGGYLAGVLDAPILLTAPNTLPVPVQAAIGTLGATKAYILGGTGAVSAGVEAELVALGLDIERIAGANREATAAEIAGMGIAVDTAFVVQGRAPADSMVAGAAAFAKGYPILLVGQDSVPAVTEAAITSLGIENIIIVGGSGVVSTGVATKLGNIPGVTSVTRLSGVNRETTSVEFAKGQFPDCANFSIVNGRQGLADAVGSSVFGNPILYVQTDTVPAVVGSYLEDMVTCESMIYIFGGGAVVSAAVEAEIQAIKDDAVCLKIAEVSDADELYDALFDQCDYDVIRLVADIDEDVDYDVKLSCDIILDLNGFKLSLDPGYDFLITAENITIKGSEIEILDGDFFAYGGGDGLNLTIDGVEVNIPNGSFYAATSMSPLDIASVESNDPVPNSDLPGRDDKLEIWQGRINKHLEIVNDDNIDLNSTSAVAEVNLSISGSKFNIGGVFLAESSGFDGLATVNIADSEFVTGFWFIVYAYDEVTLDISSNSDFEIGTYVTGYAGNKVTANISDSTINSDNYVYFGAWAEEAGSVNVNIADSGFVVNNWFWIDAWDEATLDVSNSDFKTVGFGGGALNRFTANISDLTNIDDDNQVYFGVWEEQGVLTLDISDSNIMIDGPQWGFYVDAEYPGQAANINISGSEFTLNNNNAFQIWANHGSGTTDATVNIVDCYFEDISSFYIDADGKYLESLTFGGSLDEGIYLYGDTTINGLTFKEGITDFDFDFYSSEATLTMLGDIVLEHEANDMVLYTGNRASQLRGNGNAITGEGKVRTSMSDTMAIYDLVFEVPFEINDYIHLSSVTLAETLVNSDFNVFRTVTLTDDMVLGDNVTIYAERAPLPLSEEVKVRGTLVGEGDITIDGDGNILTLEDNLMLKNLSLTNLNVWVANEATVVFEDMVLNVGFLDFADGAKLLLASDLLITDDIAIASLFTNDEGVFDGDGFSVLTDNNAVIVFDGSSGGTVKNIIFELEVFFVGENYIFEEVIFNKDFTVEGDALMIGGGWAADATVTVDASTLTFGAGQAKVNNAGNLVLVNGGTVGFVTNEETDLEYPL